MKELAYGDYLLRDFNDDQKDFITREIYPQLHNKLKELV